MLKFKPSKTITIQNWIKFKCEAHINRCLSQLVEIGKFEMPKTKRYQTGQMFLHKLFGYRGLIVFPWTGQVFDRDLEENSGDIVYDLMFVGGREVKYYTKNYYQVFVDSRDRPYCKTLNEISIPVATTTNHFSRLLQCAPGLDYVAQEDILPYKPTEQIPIKHEMIGEFFIYRPANNICFEPRDFLKSNIIKNITKTKIDVHKETTENIRIIAIPTYLGNHKTENATIHSWRYSIQIENLTGSSVRLLSQNWKIFSLNGFMEEVCGHGVMGEEVTIDNCLPAFQFSSHINLLTPFGHMIGTFKMEKQDFSKFTCRVPHIMLESRRGTEEIEFY